MHASAAKQMSKENCDILLDLFQKRIFQKIESCAKKGYFSIELDLEGFRHYEDEDKPGRREVNAKVLNKFYREAIVSKLTNLGYKAAFGQKSGWLFKKIEFPDRIFVNWE